LTFLRPDKIIRSFSEQLFRFQPIAKIGRREMRV